MDVTKGYNSSTILVKHLKILALLPSTPSASLLHSIAYFDFVECLYPKMLV
jgi:hypothetical protein